MYINIYIYITVYVYVTWTTYIYIYTIICMNMHSNDRTLDLLSVIKNIHIVIVKHINTSIVAMLAFKHPNSPPLFHHGIDPRTRASKGEVCELHGVFFPVACQIKSYHSLSSIKKEGICVGYHQATTSCCRTLHLWNLKASEVARPSTFDRVILP